MEKYEEKLTRLIEDPQPLLIVGPTGSGKSTLLPILLAKKFPNSRVAFLQPRRIATTALYEFLKEKIPISYKIRHSKIINKEAKITLMTDGLFLSEYLHSDRIKYDIVVVDEVHERSLRTEIILNLLKYKNLPKIILMSATLGGDKIEKYFGANIFRFSANPYPLKIFYEERPVADYITAAYYKTREILMENTGGDILIFLSGEEDIDDLYRLLKKIPYIAIFKMHSTAYDTEQSSIFKEIKETKVILSTNICETSVTIPGIKHVIDTGFCKMKIFKGISHFGLRAISKESADQRAGRANRTGAGCAYRLYTEDAYNSLEAAIPEIRKTNLDYFLLFFLKNKIDPFTSNYLEIPNKENLDRSIELLRAMHAIALIDKKLTITKYGISLLKNPIDMNLSHFLNKCNERDCGIPGAMVAALISVENFNFLENIRATKLTDILFLYRLMDDYLGKKTEEAKLFYCEEQKISKKGIDKAVLVFKQLKKSAKGNNTEKLEEAFSKAFSHNRAVSEKDGSYRTTDKKILYVSPSSFFFAKRTKNIVFVDICYTNKPYARIVGSYI